MSGPILDTNVLLRHLLEDNAEQSPRATEFMMSLAKGEVSAELPMTVLFEANYILQGTYGRTREEVVAALTPILGLPNLSISERDAAVRTLQLYAEHNISFADAFHAALAEQNEPPQILSFDRGFNRIRTIQRIEP